MDFTILLEQDYSSNNFCAYVPELRLSTVGDTEEETLENAKDLIRMELEKGMPIKKFSSKVVSITMEETISSLA
jgi:predicted RNase H-like HicB family nuclease